MNHYSDRPQLTPHPIDPKIADTEEAPPPGKDNQEEKKTLRPGRPGRPI